MKPELTTLGKLAKKTGLSICFIEALIGISKPARSALRLQLNSIKVGLQAQLATLVFKATLNIKKKISISKYYAMANAGFSQIKSVLNLLNFGPEFDSCPEVQKLINSLLSAAKIKGVDLGGYKDAENILTAINFKIQQYEKAIDFDEKAVKAINKKIDDIDKYIEVLDAIDELE
jgi:tetratricopeptide (TPR) repeat protein